MNADFYIGPWLVEPTLNRISRNGASRHLEPKVMQVLVCLADEQGRLVAKQKLMEKVWPETFVTEDVLTRSISELRNAFGDDARDPRIIQTIPKAGYRLITTIAEVPGRDRARPSRPAILRPKWLVGVGLVVLLIAVIYAVLISQRSSSPRTAAVSGEHPNLKATRLTHSGSLAAVEGAEAISPDGKLLFYVHLDNGRNSIRMRQLNSGSEVTVLPPTEREIYGLTVTPPGDYLYFVERNPDQQRGDLKLIPALGGPSRTIVKAVLSPAAVSPDGARIAFLRRRERVGVTWEVVIANSDGAEERIAHSRVPPKAYRHSYRLSWSPDGKNIAAPASDDQGEKGELVVIDVESGAEAPLTPYQWPKNEVGDAIWLPDGSGLVVQARQRGENMHLWHVQVPSGEVRRLTSGATDYYSVCLSADGSGIITTQYNPSTTIWVSDYSDPSRARQVTFLPKATDGLPGWPIAISWVGLDKLVFASRQSGNPDLWLLDLQSGERRRLTDHPGQDWFPASSPDGKYIYYASGRSGQPNVWRMDADGNNLQQITYSMAYHPAISADGQTLTFETTVNGLFRPVRMPASGGEVEMLLDSQAARAVYSFDGKKIMIGRVTTERGPDLEQTVILEARTRARLQTIEGTHWSFTPDGRGLLFLGKYNGTINLMVRPLGKGSPYPLTTLRDERVHGFAISADGKRLAIVRAKEELDAVLITNFR